MLVAAHILLLACTLVLPIFVGLRLAKRFAQPRALVAMGVLAFVMAELLRMALEALAHNGFESGALPMPSVESAQVVRSLLGAIALALTVEGVRYFFFRRQIPDHQDGAGALVFGAAVAGGMVGLFGLLELVSLIAALVWKDVQLAELEAVGLSAEVARKLGLVIYGWWERTPGEVMVLAAEKIVLMTFQVALTLCVARAAATKKVWLAFAVVVHAAAAAAAAQWPVYGSLAYGAGLVLSAPVAWRWFKNSAKPASSAL